MKYPEDWYIRFETPNIELTNSKGYVHGLGVPNLGEMSVTIMSSLKSHDVACEATSAYRADADWPGLLPMEKIVCLNDVMLILEYTDHYKQPLSTFQVEENKKILEIIFSTFKFIPLKN